jgi:serine phosphatase RsbU (regulator of sigma subunit)
LNESRDAAGRHYGVDRVKADVRRHAAGTPDGIARALVDAALAHAPTTRPADDMTAVVIQRCP